MRSEFAFLEALNQARIADVRLRIQVRHRLAGHNLVNLREIGVFPMFPHTLLRRFLEARIIDAAFQVCTLGFIQKALKVRRNNRAYTCA